MKLWLAQIEKSAVPDISYIAFGEVFILKSAAGAPFEIEIILLDDTLVEVLGIIAPPCAIVGCGERSGKICVSVA